MTEPFTEHRHFHRIEALDQFLIEFKNPKKKMPEKGYGCDLSPAGARFATLIPFQPGDTMQLSVTFAPEFPGKKQIVLKSRVIYCKKSSNSYYHRVGCQFSEELTGSNLEILKEFLAWAEKRKPAAGKKMSQDSFGGGKRIAHRVVAKDQFIAEFKKDNKTLLDKGFGWDLSTHGALVTTLARLQTGQRCDVTLQFHPDYRGQRKVKLKGTVVRVEEPLGSHYLRIAFQFEEHSPEQKEISHFIKWVESARVK